MRTSISPRAQRCKSKAGYTVIELVMAMAVFAIGVTGVAAMQSATTVSNRHAKNIAIASAIAKTWQEELAVDATVWTATNAASLQQTSWVQLVNGAGNGAWVLPATVGTMGATFDALGNFTAVQANTVFCAHIRLTRLIQTQGSGLVRADVRVFWPRHGHDWEQAAYCTAAVGTNFRTYAPDETTNQLWGTTELDNFHFVYTSSAIRETPP